MSNVSQSRKFSDQDSGPWWREPWPWLLMLGPALAVVGCAITIFLAFQSYGGQAIEDGGHKQGLYVSGPAAAQPAAPKEH
ncbi:hypothetical protein KVP09_04595 [Alcaligenaceae bacterium CGII-47]|nr:hypothetical protein [Alcaligenaceae bacterium CGII-47]